MLRKWMMDVVSAREVASEVRAYLVALARRVDDQGWLNLSADDALDEARRLGRYRRPRAGVVDGAFQCGCGSGHLIGDATIQCNCGARYYVEWSGDGCRVVEQA